MRRASRRRRWLANFFLLAGVLALVIWTWSNAQRAVFQSWENWVFERKVHGEPATVTQFLGEKKEQIVLA